MLRFLKLKNKYMIKIKHRYKYHRNLNNYWYRYYRNTAIEEEREKFKQSGKTLEEYTHDWLNEFKKV